MKSSIETFMTPMPKSIGYDQTLAQARDYMRKLKLRHLPVLKGGHLVGILSDRDLKFILQFEDVDPLKVTVEEASTPEPYTVNPSTPVNEVVSHMAEKKYGCALVVDQNKVVGIFTEVDAYKLLSKLLQPENPH